MDLLDRLLDFDHWAMDELLRVSEGLSDAQLDQEFDIGHRTVRATFGHMIYNIPFWTGLMLGQQPEPEPEAGLSNVQFWTAHLPDQWAETGLSIAAMREWYEAEFETFASLTRQLRDEGRLDEIYVDHYNVRKSMSGTILMVILHASEHRTEIAHMLARLGVSDVPEVDLGARDYELLNL
jgi:uncharacterized damage-inducible protein DinB